MLFDIGREVVAVVVVLGILAASLWGLRRFQKPRDSDPGPLRVLAKLRLSEQLVVHLIECAGERCLVAEQRSGSAVVSWRPEFSSPPPQSPKTAPAEGFDTKFPRKRAAAC